MNGINHMPHTHTHARAPLHRLGHVSVVVKDYSLIQAAVSFYEESFAAATDHYR
jgi:hypothetical protein